NDPRVFGFGSNHETRHVLQKEERRFVTIAGLDEVSGFLGGIRVDDAAEFRARARAQEASLICNDADGYAFDAGIAGDHLLRVISLKLVKLACVDEAVEDISHIVRKPMIRGYNVIQIRQRPARGHSRLERDSARLRKRKLGDKPSELFQTFLVVLCSIMSYARDLVMSERAAQ